MPNLHNVCTSDRSSEEMMTATLDLAGQKDPAALWLGALFGIGLIVEE